MKELDYYKTQEALWLIINGLTFETATATCASEGIIKIDGRTYYVHGSIEPTENGNSVYIQIFDL